MSNSAAAKRVVQDAVLLLKTVRDELADERKPYASDIRRIVDHSLVLKFGEYVQFLERYGFLEFERRSKELKLTRAGEDLIAGKAARLSGLAEDATFHFGARLDELSLGNQQAGSGVRMDKRYLRLECIGGGALGRVWTGYQLALDRPVSIKMFEGLDEVFRGPEKASMLRRLELTVRAHASLISPYIVQILDQNVQHEPPYVVMEQAPGGSLKSLLANGALPAPIAIRYFMQMALGLKTAHDAGVIHRDLKPQNVLLDALGNVKLCDFGMSQVADGETSMLRRAYVGYGSLGYMAPEMFTAGGEASGSADIYSLGIIFYEMLTGRLPGRRSPMPSEVVSDLPKEIDDLFDAMAQDDVEQRIGSIDDVLRRVWDSSSIYAMLDARSAPLFVHPPVALPGLEAVVDMSQASTPARSHPNDLSVEIPALTDAPQEQPPSESQSEVEVAEESAEPMTADAQTDVPNDEAEEEISSSPNRPVIRPRGRRTAKPMPQTEGEELKPDESTDIHRLASSTPKD